MAKLDKALVDLIARRDPFAGPSEAQIYARNQEPIEPDWYRCNVRVETWELDFFDSGAEPFSFVDV